MKQRIAIVQYDIRWCDWESNRGVLADILAANRHIYSGHRLDDVDVVVLPEMFMTGFVVSVDKVAEYAEYAERTLAFMREVAQSLDAAVVGSVVCCDGGEYRNRMYFVKPSGEVEWYDKHHLFSIGGETELFTAGAERKIVEWRGVNYLLEVCYDLRFPVWSRQRGDYDAIIYSALWPKPRRDVWSVLLRARAIGNQSYVIGVNRVGDEPTLSYSGDSVVVDYRGRSVVECGDKECVAIAEIDLLEQRSFKERFDVGRDADNFEIK